MTKTAIQEDRGEMTFKVEHGVPIPDRHYAPNFPFDKMKVGDSFVVKTHRQRDRARLMANLRGMKVATRMLPNKDGFRVWRTK